MVEKGIKEKHTTLTRLLDEEYALVHLDPAARGVTLPQHLMGGPTVTLKISRLFRGAMKVEGERVVADLLFGDDYFTCVVPFAAVWGMTSAAGSNIMWPEDTPDAVREKIIQPQPGVATVSASPDSADETPKKRAHLRRVK